MLRESSIPSYLGSGFFKIKERKQRCGLHSQLNFGRNVNEFARIQVNHSLVCCCMHSFPGFLFWNSKTECY